MTDMSQAAVQNTRKEAYRRASSRLTRSSLLIWNATLAALFAVAAMMPSASNSLSFWFYLLQWITLATAVNLVAGLVGYLPFGFVAFFGIGSYAAAVLTQFHGVSAGWSICGAATAGAALALLFAPTMRLSGVFFSIVSLSLSIVLKSLVSILPEHVAGGSSGVTITAIKDPALAYYLMVALCLVSLAIATLIAVTPYGLRLKAIRDDAGAAAMIGINVTRLRLSVWLLSATIASTCGGIEALYSSVIDPSASFNMLISAKAIIYAALGGLGTVMGPLLGALLMSVVDELIWARFPIANLFILGALISLTVLSMPGGMIGWLLDRHPRFRRWFF
ncbi:branched-chain amino acid transport system permease protein [Bradyrhizobium elkanii]|uniref:Branched-chain amino acid transport system permease protein n=2 Tax=Bradyrhizobium elkanii TaxID=29448 RepID=A0A8I2C7J2_BRAEL|nr:branched-chain amino acid transport system permease protein [Bradyrhizobium elkanii]